MRDKPVKTRFAPSPTGYMHVGNLRTALYAYLFAKRNNGKFVLRIEDTDQNRQVEGAMENLIETLQYFDLDYDEGPLKDDNEKGEFGPYIQSHRSEIYKKYCDELITNGKAYRCFCNQERLDEMRERQVQNKQATMYDRLCADLPESEILSKMAEGLTHVVRQKIPFELIKFKDIVRGNVQFHGKTIDDQVLMKSDGLPTYHLANVVDDHLMKITHVIRGEEWLPSTPKHIALYEAFGWEPPEFAHLPLFLNADRTKLSKRQGDVSVDSYIKKGYLKAAIINFVTFLGWHPGAGEEEEIYTLDELEQIFELEKVHKAGAIFNLEKLDWFNWKWQKRNFDEDPRPTAEKLHELADEYLDPKYKEASDKLDRALETVLEKILKDPKAVNEYIDFYFHLPNYDQELLTHEKMRVDLETARNSLKKSAEVLENLNEWTAEKIEEALRTAVQSLEIKNGQLFWPLRVALSGLQYSPGVFEIPYVLGKDETLNRISIAISKL